MRKKLLSLALALCMALALLPTAACAADSDFVIENGELTEYTGPGGAVTIPNGVTKIGGIWDQTAIYGAFQGRESLTSVTIPNSVTEIGDSAFSGCVGLTSVTIPNSVAKIGNSAFSGCVGLTSVTIPNSVAEIGVNAFGDCAGLTSIQVEPDNRAYTAVDGVLFNKSMTELIQYPTGRKGSYSIPNSVTKIEPNAFRDCAGLTSVTIPDGVTSIGGFAFNGCTGLASVTIPSGVTEIEDGVFGNCTGLTNVTIPDSDTSIGGWAFEGCTGLTSVTIPDCVTTIGNSAFEGCTGLTSVTIPSSVTYIGSNAFKGTPWLKNQGEFAIMNGILLAYQGKGGAVTIPSGVTEIGVWAFYGCTGLTSVTIPSSVTRIGMLAFCGCTGLTSVTIPNGVTFIGYGAFEDCIGLASITIPDSVTEIEGWAFQHTPWLKNQGEFAIVNGILLAYQGKGGAVTIPSGVTEIGKRAFDGCIDVTSVTIPGSVTKIHSDAFMDCFSLTSVTIPSSVTSIGSWAFTGVISGLKDIYYGGSQAQWNSILEVNDDDNSLKNVTIHYNSTGPDKPAKDVAHASAQTVTVDGKPVEFQMYALKDASGNDTNYIKLRDMAYVLNGTKTQFNVGYDQQSGTITAATGIAYKEDGTEMTATFGGADKEYVKTTLTIQLDGKPVQLEAITLTDSTGGGYNYCKVRDLGQTFNFNVDWKAGVGIYIESDKPYSG